MLLTHLDVMIINLPKNQDLKVRIVKFCMVILKWKQLEIYGTISIFGKLTDHEATSAENAKTPHLF